MRGSNSNILSVADPHSDKALAHAMQHVRQRLHSDLERSAIAGLVCLSQPFTEDSELGEGEIKMEPDDGHCVFPQIIAYPTDTPPYTQIAQDVHESREAQDPSDIISPSQSISSQSSIEISNESTPACYQMIRGEVY